MKQSLAHTFIILSLVLSSISFILSLIAFYLPNWKYIQFRLTSSPMILSENNQIDPLIRGEIEKYSNILYHPGQTHSYGLFAHCIAGSQCGRNRLLSFDETNYGLCHNIKYHNQCIFSTSLLLLEKCTCKKPSYINIIHTLLIIVLILELLFILVSVLRLYRHCCHISCLNDIQLRLAGIISTLFSSVFLITIIIQQNNNRLNEPLEYFETMRQHYSRKQIYSFSHDLELILKQIEQNLDIHLGASYICIIFILIFTIISFFTSSTVEIKLPSTSDDDEKKNEHHHILLPPPSPMERFIPYEQIRFTRQTKV